MKTKHTPGPWRISKISGYITGVASQYKVEGGVFNEMVCNSLLPDTDDEYAKQKAQIKADMSLIASAPELLDALETLVFLHSCEQEGIGCGQPTPKQWIDAVDAAEKAIQKAKGENK